MLPAERVQVLESDGEEAHGGIHRRLPARWKWQIARRLIDRIFGPMKTAAISELPKVWADILRWVTAGEEVQLTDSDKTVARVLPPAPAAPDFLARAQAIWGEQAEGTPLSALVEEGRGTR